MRIVLHIGMHKTGTSAIQNFCRINQQLLYAQGIGYPTNLFKKHPGQHSELYDLTRHNGVDGVADFASDLHSKYVDTCDTVFLSGESLCAADKDLAGLVIDGLLRVFSHVDVVFVVRNKPDYLYSAFNQHMRFAAYTVTFDTFVKRMKYTPRATFDSWYAEISKHKSSELTIINYEDMRKTFIQSFFGKVFRGCIELSKLREPDQQMNVAMDYISACIVNTLGKEIYGNSTEAVMRCYRQAFDGKIYRFPIEQILKQELNDRFANEGWYLPGYEDWYDDLIRLNPTIGEADPGLQYLDDLVTFLNLLRNA